MHQETQTLRGADSQRQQKCRDKNTGRDLQNEKHAEGPRKRQRHGERQRQSQTDSQKETQRTAEKQNQRQETERWTKAVAGGD